MPYDAGYAYRNPEEDEQRRAQPQLGGAAPGMMVGAPVGPRPAAPSGGSAAAPAGHFVNFGTWFGLNAPQAGNMANAVAKPVEAAGQASANALSNAQGAYGAAVQAGTPTYQTPTVRPQASSTVGQQRSGGLESTPTRPGVQDNAPAKGPATPGAITPDELAARAKAGYTGPESLSASTPGWGDMLAGARKAGAQAGALTTQGGRQSALAGQYGRGGGYAKGIGAPAGGNQRLDAGLMGVAGKPQFAGLAAKFGNLGQRFADADAASVGLATDARERAAGVAGRYAGDLAARNGAAPTEPAPITLPSVGPDGSPFMPLEGTGGKPGPGLETGLRRGASIQSIVDSSGLSRAQAEAVYNAMTDEEWQRWAQGTDEGDPYKYLPGGKEFFKNKAGGK